ncbi:Uncharacterised protein [Roseomonas gilardii subsp. rosea]|nr:Uncharacterised protein [Roseomonas gilardii subsp. rosea]
MPPEDGREAATEAKPPSKPLRTKDNYGAFGIADFLRHVNRMKHINSPGSVSLRDMRPRA